MRRHLPLVLALALLAAVAPEAHAQVLVNAVNATAGVGVATAPVPGAPDVELLGPVGVIPAKERTNVFVEVVNLGPGGMHGVSVLVQPATGGLVVVGQLTRNLDDIAQNASTPIVVRIATPDAAGGATLSMTFTFTTDAGAQVSLTRTVSIQIAPPLSDPLAATYQGDPLTAGRRGELNLTLANRGTNPVTSLDVTLIPAQAAVAIGTTQATVTPGNESSSLVRGGTLAPGAKLDLSAPVVTSLRPGDLQRFTLTAHYSYLGFDRDQTFDFGARVEGSTQLRVLDARQEPTADGLEITGTLVNTGTGTAWNPRVGVAPGSGFTAPQGPQLIEDLKPNEAIAFRIPVTRSGTPTPGAPLLRLDWNDDFGQVQAQDVPATAMPVPTAPPSPLSQILSRIASPDVLVLLALVALLVIAGLVARRIRLRHEEEEEDAAGESAEEEEASRTRQRPRGRHRAKPGG